MKRVISWMMALMMSLSLMAVQAAAEDVPDIESLYKAKDADDTWSEDATVITLLGTAAQSDSSAVRVDGNTVTISKEGEYVLTGSLQGQVVIETSETEKVHLILSGASIESESGPAILEKLADKLIVTLAEGTVNTLSDATALQDGEEAVAAALYAEDDLSINGKGKLVIQGNAGNGIQSKADLVIADGELQITAANDGIKGRNSVLVLSGSLTVQSGGDAIVSTRDDKEGKGYVVIAGGVLSLTTGSGAGETVSTASANRGRGGWAQSAKTQTDSISRKGIKAATSLTVCGGTVELNTQDDALHADRITIADGTLTIRTGDDGLHGDTAVSILGGSISIDRCNEGVEGANIAISGGVTVIVSSDDGVNATSGTATGMNREAPDGSVLAISGGELYVTAGNDALDSNGSISITGGIVGLSAVTTMGDGTVDANGNSTMTGGTVILATSGNAGMGVNALSGTEMMTVSASGSAGNAIQLLDENGTILGDFTPQSSFSLVMVASSALASGDNVEVQVADRVVYSGALTGTSYVYGSGAPGGMGGQGNFGGGRNGGFGGGRGGRGGW